MKTVYLINSLEGGGAERVFSQLLEMVTSETEMSEPIDIILLDVKPEVYPLPTSAKVHRIGRSPSALWPCIQFVKVLILLARIKPKKAVSFLTRANLFNVMCGQFLGFQSVISERSNTAGRISGRFSSYKRSLVSFFYTRADKIIAVSKGVADCLVEEFSVLPNKVVVLNNPVDIALIEQNANRVDWQFNQEFKPKIVAMGRLVDTKGFVDLIHAYAQSQQTCGLMILGDGPKRQELQQLITSLAMDSQVHLIGFVDNPYAVIKQADIFVLSSELEGFPNALVESMALGKAVVSTNCNDGPREILSLNSSITMGEPARTDFGLMVNVSDRVGMARAITRLVEDAALCQQLSANARERVKQYSKKEFYKNYKEIVNRIDSAEMQVVKVKSRVL